MTGAVSSTTTMVRLQLELFPQSSVAVHVLVTLYSAGQVPLTVTSLKVTVGVASHASVTVGGVNTGVFGQLTGVACATQVIIGAVSSTTWMVALHEALLPQSSVAVQVRVTLYSAGHVPLVVTSANVTVGVASHASVTVGGVNTGVFGQLSGVV